MAARITIKNEEPGFSDARVAIRIPGEDRRVLNGGESAEIIAESGQSNQIVIQALKRTGEE